MAFNLKYSTNGDKPDPKYIVVTSVDDGDTIKGKLLAPIGGATTYPANWELTSDVVGDTFEVRFAGVNCAELIYPSTYLVNPNIKLGYPDVDTAYAGAIAAKTFTENKVNDSDNWTYQKTGDPYENYKIIRLDFDSNAIEDTYGRIIGYVNVKQETKSINLLLMSGDFEHSGTHYPLAVPLYNFEADKREEIISAYNTKLYELALLLRKEQPLEIGSKLGNDVIKVVGPKQDLIQLRDNNEFWIGATKLTVGPQNIRVHSATPYSRNMGAMRQGGGGLTAQTGSGVITVTMELVFGSIEALNLELKPLIVYFRHYPIQYIESNFLRNYLPPHFSAENMFFKVPKTMAACLTSLNISKSSEAPGVVSAELTMQMFNYDPFTMHFWFNDTPPLPDFTNNSLAIHGIDFDIDKISMGGIVEEIRDNDTVSTPQVNYGLAGQGNNSTEASYRLRVGESYDAKVIDTFLKTKLENLYGAAKISFVGEAVPLENIDTADTNNKKLFAALSPDAADSLINIALHETTSGIQVTSMFRTYAQQAAIKRRMGRRAAGPGRSWHESGNAVDVSRDSILDMVRLGEDWYNWYEYGTSTDPDLTKKIQIIKAAIEAYRANPNSANKTTLQQYVYDKNAIEIWHFTYRLAKDTYSHIQGDGNQAAKARGDLYLSLEPQSIAELTNQAPVPKVSNGDIEEQVKAGVSDVLKAAPITTFPALRPIDSMLFKEFFLNYLGKQYPLFVRSSYSGSGMDISGVLSTPSGARSPYQMSIPTEMLKIKYKKWKYVQPIKELTDYQSPVLQSLFGDGKFEAAILEQLVRIDDDALRPSRSVTAVDFFEPDAVQNKVGIESYANKILPYMQQEAATSIRKLATEFKEKYGRPLQYEDMYRTLVMQAYKRIKHGTNAAMPGRSWHEAGYAIDIARKDVIDFITIDVGVEWTNWYSYGKSEDGWIKTNKGRIEELITKARIGILSEDEAQELKDLVEDRNAKEIWHFTYSAARDRFGTTKANGDGDQAEAAVRALYTDVLKGQNPGEIFKLIRAGTTTADALRSAVDHAADLFTSKKTDDSTTVGDKIVDNLLEEDKTRQNAAQDWYKSAIMENDVETWIPYHITSPNYLPFFFKPKSFVINNNRFFPDEDIYDKLSGTDKAVADQIRELNEGAILNSIGVFASNAIVTIPMEHYPYPTFQFMGGDTIDMGVGLAILTETEQGKDTLYKLTELKEDLISNTKVTHGIRDVDILEIHNDIINFFGVYHGYLTGVDAGVDNQAVGLGNIMLKFHGVNSEYLDRSNFSNREEVLDIKPMREEIKKIIYPEIIFPEHKVREQLTGKLKPSDYQVVYKKTDGKTLAFKNILSQAVGRINQRIIDMCVLSTHLVRIMRLVNDDFQTPIPTINTKEILQKNNILNEQVIEKVYKELYSLFPEEDEREKIIENLGNYFYVYTNESNLQYSSLAAQTFVTTPDFDGVQFPREMPQNKLVSDNDKIRDILSKYNYIVNVSDNTDVEYKIKAVLKDLYVYITKGVYAEATAEILKYYWSAPEFEGVVREYIKDARKTRGKCYPDMYLMECPWTGSELDTNPGFLFYDGARNKAADIGTIKKSTEEVWEQLLRLKAHANGTTGFNKLIDPKEKVSTNMSEFINTVIDKTKYKSLKKEDIDQLMKGESVGSIDGAKIKAIADKTEGPNSELSKAIAKISAENKNINFGMAQKMLKQEDIMNNGTIDASSLEATTKMAIDNISKPKGMSRAFPTFKIYAFEDDTTEDVTAYSMGLDELYNIPNIIDIRFHEAKEMPASVCVFTVSDPYGILTNATMEGTILNATESMDPLDLDTDNENQFKQFSLAIGMNIHVRLGYDNDPARLTPIFNGQIVDMSPIQGGLQCVCQSYGAELVVNKFGVTSAVIKFDYIQTMLYYLMLQPELKHFGRWQPEVTNLTPDFEEKALPDRKRNTWLNKKWFQVVRWYTGNKKLGDTPADDCIFLPKHDYEAGWFETDMVQKYEDYYIYNQYIWDIFKQMELRYPGYIAYPVMYGRQYRMFFGMPDFVYPFKPATIDEQEVTNLSKKLLDGLSPDLLTRQQGWKEALFKIDSIGKDLYNRLSAPLQLMSRLLASHRYKPFRQYHSVNGQEDIVKNEIVVTSRATANEVKLIYDKLSHAGRLFNTVSFSYSDDIAGEPWTPPEAEIDRDSFVTVQSNLYIDRADVNQIERAFYSVFSERDAYDYAHGVLANEAREMYNGRLTIIGNPDIKPYDIVFLHDEKNCMFGPFEVASVTHIMSKHTGFTTEIRPHMCVWTNDISDFIRQKIASQRASIAWWGRHIAGGIAVGAALTTSSFTWPFWLGLVAILGPDILYPGSLEGDLEDYGWFLAQWTRGKNPSNNEAGLQPLILQPLILVDKPMIGNFKDLSPLDCWQIKKNELSRYFAELFVDAEKGWDDLKRTKLNGSFWDIKKEQIANDIAITWMDWLPGDLGSGVGGNDG